MFHSVIFLFTHYVETSIPENLNVGSLGHRIPLEHLLKFLMSKQCSASGLQENMPMKLPFQKHISHTRCREKSYAFTLSSTTINQLIFNFNF